MIAWEAHPEGVVLPVRAHPSARKNAITGIHHGQLKVAVTQAAEKGKANQAILEVLCRELDLKKSQCELLSGATARTKRILVRNISEAALWERLIRLGPIAEEHQ